MLGWKNLATDDLAANRLVQPFEHELPLGASFYFVYPKLFTERSKLMKFRNWLKHEISKG